MSCLLHMLHSSLTEGVLLWAVSTCFEQGNVGDSKSIWLSTSHKLDVNHMLATHYADDLKGGADFTLNTSHNFVPASRLSTCFHAESLGDPTLEVELEQDREARKVSTFFGPPCILVVKVKGMCCNLHIEGPLRTKLNCWLIPPII
jgi:hypothetical protein